MKKKLKLKLKFKIILLIAVFGIFLGIYLKNEYTDYIYEQTYEYKFTSIGYTIEEYNTLESEFSSDKLDEFLNLDYDENILLIINSKYYISSNFDLYYEYFYKEDYSIEDIISMVNVSTIYEQYEITYETDTSLESLMLVNKYNYLTSDYVVDDLVSVSTKYSWGEYGSQSIKEEVYDAFVLMAEGLYNQEEITLMINSSYRDYESQEEIYNNYKDSYGSSYADSIAARAGFSEHQTGYALDIFSLECSSISTFADSLTYAWLVQNSYKYGFILRYPEDKEYITGYSFESWHYRYVGVEAATYIYENDITFDEYYAYFIAN